MKIIASMNMTKKDFENTKLKLEKKEMIKKALGKDGRIYKVESEPNNFKINFYLELDGKILNSFKSRMCCLNFVVTVISTKVKNEVEIPCWCEMDGVRKEFYIKKDSVVEMIRTARALNDLSGYPLYRKESIDHILMYSEGRRKINMKVGRCAN